MRGTASIPVPGIGTVYKKGETQLPGNYRPISLLSAFDKLLEKKYAL